MCDDDMEAVDLVVFIVEVHLVRCIPLCLVQMHTYAGVSCVTVFVECDLGACWQPLLQRLLSAVDGSSSRLHHCCICE